MPPITNHRQPMSASGNSAKPLSVAKAEDLTDLVQYLKELSINKSYQKVEYFKKSLLASETEDSVLINWFHQLKDNIFLLDKDNEYIVRTLLEFDWSSRSDEIVSIYQELVLNIVSAHTYYLQQVLQMILRIFSSEKLNEEGKIDDSFKHCHALLQNIFKLVPSSPNIMCQLIAKEFPYLKQASGKILSYSMNALNICTYLPSHRLRILECLIDKYLLIDVHCPRNVIESMEASKEEESEMICDMELNNEETSKDDMAFPLANTLDLLMDGLFKFIRSCCLPNGDDKPLDWEATKKLYRELLTAFDNVILPTSRSCHVPYVMFYVCSLRPALCEGYLDFLWKKVTDLGTASTRKQLATFYIGSLLARASYINISTVMACFDLMCNWIHSYIQNYDGYNSSDIVVHGTFYCVCQMLFYVFAFRHKEFVSMENGFRYLRNLNFERIVTCRLNPLKFCQPTIMQNFANVARNYQVAYCFPIIERNNRSLMRSTVNFSSLSVFFPFDPYLLKRSKHWVEQLYRVYEAHDDDDQMEEESFIEDGANTSVNDDLFTYSRSPGFKQLHHVTPER